MISLTELKKSLTHRCPFPDEEFDALMEKGEELHFAVSYTHLLLKVTTLGEEVEWILLTDTPVAGAYQLEAGADKSARYAFTLSTGDTTTDNLDGIIAGGAGAYVFTVELYAAACEDPNNPRIPEGTYTFDGHPPKCSSTESVTTYPPAVCVTVTVLPAAG